MGTTGLNEGHEKTGTGATWQSDGLRDSDVISTATLTNFTERGLLNGVLPISLTNYSQDAGGSDRNNPIAGNCCVRKNTGGTKSFFVDAGVVSLDGMFYTVGSASSLDIDTAGLYNSRFNPLGVAGLPSAVNEEAWVLVIVDPESGAGTNNISLVCGQKVNTGTGAFPQMPSAHLVKQSVVLAAIRVTNGPVVSMVEDKRVFIRGGPYPVTKMINASGAGTDPINNLVTTPSLGAGTLPESGLGLFYARDPAGSSPPVVASSGTSHGAGQTHLFFQSDQAVGASSGGAYQITPIHRQSKEVYAYAGPGTISLKFSPLPIEVPSLLSVAGYTLTTAVWSDSTRATSVSLAEGLHFTISGKTVTMSDLATNLVNPYTNPPAPIAPPGFVEFYYTHAGY